MLSDPLLVCLDLQRAFIEPGRFHTPNGANVLVHGRRVLNLAREQRWRIVHCMMRPCAAPVWMSDKAARPVEGFEPSARETVLERETLSAYGHGDFDRIMGATNSGAVVIGLCASLSFLATSIDAFERGQRLILAGAALAASSGIEAGASDHEAVARDIARFLGFPVGGSTQALPMIDIQSNGASK